MRSPTKRTDQKPRVLQHANKPTHSASLPQGQFHLPFPNSMWSAFKKGLAVGTGKIAQATGQKMVHECL